MSTPEIRIAQRMRDARERLKVSQEEVGRRLGVTLRTYARWERGESHGYLMRLGDIAKALETTESELLGGEHPLSLQPTVTDLFERLDGVVSELHQLREDLEGSGALPRKRSRSRS